MTDILKQAKDLIEKFDRKITEVPDYANHKWQVGASEDNNGIAFLYVHYYHEIFALDIDIEAMSSVPQMLAVIKELVEKNQRETNLFLKAYVGWNNNREKLEQENQVLKYKIATLESGEQPCEIL